MRIHNITMTNSMSQGNHPQDRVVVQGTLLRVVDTARFYLTRFYFAYRRSASFALPAASSDFSRRCMSKRGITMLLEMPEHWRVLRHRSPEHVSSS